MKRLILMRHAKSSWADEGQRDHERPLNDRGRRDAPLMGDWLVAKGFVPSLALVSDAVRTRETWSAIGFALHGVEMQIRPDLYDAPVGSYIQALRSAPDVPCVLMLGHMPSVGAFARTMLREPPEAPDFAKYPTSAVTVIALDIENWRAADRSAGALLDFVTPKSLV